jgi:hypothetical protein
MARESVVPISSVEQDNSSLRVKGTDWDSSLKPIPAPMPRAASPFAGLVGRSFFYVGLWVERCVAWRKRVPTTRAYRDFAELLQPEVANSSPQASPLPPISLPETSALGSTMLPVQPAAASGPAVALKSNSDLLVG